MATSGTISTTVFNTRKVIDNAFGMCRLKRQQITGEMIEVASDQLYLFLSSLANPGVPLWCQTRYILPLYQGIFDVPMPPGSIDVLDANLRTLMRLTGAYTSSEGSADLAFDGNIYTDCTQTAAGGFIQMTMGATAPMTSVGILPAASGVWDMELQYSVDGVTFTTFYVNPILTVVDGVWFWMDFNGLPPALAYKLVATAPTVLNVAELVFANTPQEINMARLNKDDYFYLPDKTFQGRPVQFWLDRQREGPIMKLWPAPDEPSVFRQITVLVHRHIMDIGTLQQEIEVPQRWYDAIVAGLAERVAVMSPEVDMAMIPITKELASNRLKLAWAEERDNSPAYLQVNISYYTK